MNNLTQLYLYLTEGCNLACRHCWLAPKYDPYCSKYPYLDIEIIKSIVNEALPLGLASVKLTGGEPLMHPSIIKIVNLINDYKLKLNIETNGLVLSKEIVNEIAKNVDAFVSVSLDGACTETHDWVRGVEGSFSAASKSIVYLANAGLRPQIVFSVMAHNVKEINQLIKLAEKLGAYSIKFNIVHPTGRGENLHNLNNTLSVKEYIQLGNRVVFELQNTTKVQLNYHYPVAFWPLSRLNKQWGGCDIHNILGVLPNGKYALCGIGEQIPELVFGIAGKDSLLEIWNEHPVLKKIREDIPNKLKGVCGRCLLKNNCKGSCIAQNYYRSRDLTSPFWFCELAENANLFPKSRLM